jgi:predicted porin
MKKSLIALAVAGVVAAPAFAATSNVDVYGQIRMSMDLNDPATGESNWTIADRVSRIGFKGSEDLGAGMKAIWQIEQQLNIDTADQTAGTVTTTATGASQTASTVTTVASHSALRNTFVGLAGGFGTVILGRHDTPYKLGGSADLFGDTAADSQSAAGIIGFKTGALGFDVRADNTLAYISPTVSGFHAAIAVIPGETSTAGTKKNGLMDAYSLVAVYENGPLKATLAYENHDDLVAESAMKANVAYALGDLKLAATYEKQSDVGGTANLENTAYLVSAAYGMGPITLMAQYGDRDHDTAASDLTRYTLGVGYSMSKRTNVYVAYNSDELNGADSSAITMGVNHSF